MWASLEVQHIILASMGRILFDPDLAEMFRQHKVDMAADQLTSIGRVDIWLDTGCYQQDVD